MKEQQFVDQFLVRDSDGDLVLQRSPCYFLGDDNKCSIYENRPLACREYPHTDRKNMYQILELTQRNTLICPAVVKVVDEIIIKYN
jgi:Fe-S-cluster containining protein